MTFQLATINPAQLCWCIKFPQIPKLFLHQIFSLCSLVHQLSHSDEQSGSRPQDSLLQSPFSSQGNHISDYHLQEGNEEEDREYIQTPSLSHLNMNLTKTKGAYHFKRWYTLLYFYIHEKRVL